VYFASVGPKTGPLRYRDRPPGSIGVLESPTNHMPIGMASCRGWDDQGRAVWTLTIGGQPLEGRWVIIDREFKGTAQIAAKICSKGFAPRFARQAGWIPR
jgi:hypothetical protein